MKMVILKDERQELPENNKGYTKAHELLLIAYDVYPLLFAP